MIESRYMNIEQVNTPGPNITQHYQQHFQQHYAATENATSAFPAVTSPGNYSTLQSAELIQTDSHNINNNNNSTTNSEFSTMFDSQPQTMYESHSKIIQTDQNGHLTQMQEKHEQKKTVHTTTTTTMTQPVIIGEENLIPQPVALNQIQPIPVYKNNDVLPSTYGIHVEHFPQNQAFNWNTIDTYLHIFLTFYFGHFAAILFFDGVIRNIAYLYILEHKSLSPLIYILSIMLSIALIAFTIWFMTICWRWWRNKSLVPLHGFGLYDSNVRQLGPKDRLVQVNGFVFTAALILIVGFFFYLILGFLDISFKNEIEKNYYIKYGMHRNSLFIADWAVYIFRLIFWIIGIVATLFLSRDVLYKYCCPAKRIKIDKEKPTSVYQVRS